MKNIQINNVQDLAGFLANAPKKGERAKILQRAKFTASHPQFYMYVIQIEEHFLVPAKVNGDAITHFLILFHNNGTANVYIDYSQMLEIKVKRDVTKGESVYVNDIDSVRRYKIENIDFAPDDAIICVMKAGWKYGLFFDFTRSTNQDEVWQQLGNLYNSLHFERVKENIQSALREAEKPHFITEGKTDWKHLEAARRKLAPGLTFGYPASEEALGDNGLLKMCKHISEFGPPNKNKVIAIFDRDNTKTLRELAKHGDINKYQSWGNNVFSLAIPIPRIRRDYKYPCIELLYADKDLLRMDEGGKRLFFDNEIKKEVLPGSGARFLAIPPVAQLEHDKKVFDELADRIEDSKGNKVGISKAFFAQYVLDQTKNFKIANFDGFKPLLKTIKEILELEPPSN